MTPLGRIFQNNKTPSVARVREAVRRDQLRFNPKTAAMLSELTTGPLSGESVDLLTELARGGPYYKNAEAILGSSGHPQAIERLVLEIERNGLRAAETIQHFSNPVNRSAVDELARIALTSSRFGSVHYAVAALEKIGTPEAEEALSKFAEAPPRDLYYDYSIDDKTGASTNIYRLSSEIGRRHHRKKVGERRYTSANANIFLSGDASDFERALQQCLASPDRDAGLVRKLCAALSKDRSSETGESGGTATEPASTSASEKLRRRLAEENTSHLEAYLLNGVARGSQESLHGYLDLPFRRPIGELPGLVASFSSLTDVQNYAAASARRFAQSVIDQARVRFDDVEFRLAAFDRAYANLTPEERPTLIQEFIEPLLGVPDWSNRRRAIESLAKLPKADREPSLRRFLASDEVDFELLQYAKTALDQP